jgi:hypothetical protein
VSEGVEFRRFNFLTADKKVVIGVVDVSFFSALTNCVAEIGACTYIGSNSPSEPPLEYKPDEQNKRGKKNWDLVPVQKTLFRGVDS